MNESDLSIENELLRALSATTCRQIVRELASRETEVVTVSSLAESDDLARKSSEIQLYHVHLPKLDEAAIVDWEQETGRIRAGPSHETAVAVLETLREELEATPPDNTE